MRIGLVFTYLSPGGGTYQYLRLAELLSKKHAVVLFVYRDYTNGKYKDLMKGIPIYAVGEGSISRKHKIIELFRPFWEQLFLVKLMLMHKVDLLNPHEWPAQWSAAIIGKLKNIPVAWVCNDVWHVPGYEEIPEKRKLHKIFRATIQHMVDVLLTKLCTVIVVLDSRIRSIVEKEYHIKTEVIRSGIDPKIFASPLATGRARNMLNLPDIFTFLCFSIFFPHRRFEDAILAFAKLAKSHKDILLVIMGSGQYAPAYVDSIKALVKRLGLTKKVKLVTSFLPYEKIRTYLAACDVFLFPNERQTWGLAVLEAMASSKLCIVSDGAGVHEVIEDGKTGLIYRAKDVEQLQERMKLAMTNRRKCKQIGKSARSLVMGTYTWEEYAKHVERFFVSL